MNKPNQMPKPWNMEQNQPKKIHISIAKKLTYQHKNNPKKPIVSGIMIGTYTPTQKQPKNQSPRGHTIGMECSVCGVWHGICCVWLA
jgi:hypothetical protein